MPTQIQIENKKTNETQTFDNKTEARAYIWKHATDDFVATKTYQAKVFGVKHINYTIAFSQKAKDMRLAQEKKIADEIARKEAHAELMAYLNDNEGNMKSYYQIGLRDRTKAQLLDEFKGVVPEVKASQKKHIIIGHIAEHTFNKLYDEAGTSTLDAYGLNNTLDTVMRFVEIALETFPEGEEE